MLKRLSLRNARRQLTEYSLFVVTIITCVSLMYAYNSLIFSENVISLMSAASRSGGDFLILMVGLITLFIILILGWFVSYMLIFMLRKRSEELAIYMFLGLERKQITDLFIIENLIIGISSLFIGLFLGIFVSEILEAIVVNMLNSSYHLSFDFSIPGAGLTFVCFVFIYIVALHICNKKLKKLELIDLIHYNQTVQHTFIRNSVFGVLIFVLSMVAGLLSLYLFTYLPLGYGYDILIGTVLTILCLFGLFGGIVPAVTLFFGKNIQWKYSKTHLFVLKEFISKINHRSILLSAIATVMTFSAVLLGLGISMSFLINEAVSLETFDIVILHLNETYDFSEYTEYLDNTGYTYASHSYTLYQNRDRSLQAIRNTVLASHLENSGSELSPEDYIFSENQFDMYIGYSDYLAIREILGLAPVELASNSFLIHCMPYLEDSYKNYMNAEGELTINDSVLQCVGVMTEPLNQYNGYGNGQEYLVVVPDEVPANLEMAYSLFVANSPIDFERLSEMVAEIDHVQLMARDESRYSYDDGYSSIINRELRDQDFISGKSVTLSSGPEVTSTIPIMYLSFILTIIGVVVIAIQLLHENAEQRDRYDMLYVLGMDSSKIKKSLRQSTYTYFILPLIPTLLLGGAIVYCVALAACSQYFYVPVIEDGQSFALTSVAIVSAIMIVVYAIYAFVCYSMLKRTLLNNGKVDKSGILLNLL